MNLLQFIQEFPDENAGRQKFKEERDKPQEIILHGRTSPAIGAQAIPQKGRKGMDASIIKMDR